MQIETGPQRAQRRAAARGLTVGAPVRIDYLGYGFNLPSVLENRPPRDPKTYAGPGGATPLGRVDRLARYMLQRDVTTHVRQGVRWQPTARQRRRLDKKERAAAVRTYLAGKFAEAKMMRENPRGYLAAMADTRGPAASAVIVDEPPRGFRVVDRRGEHRS